MIPYVLTHDGVSVISSPSDSERERISVLNRRVSAISPGWTQMQCNFSLLPPAETWHRQNKSRTDKGLSLFVVSIAARYVCAINVR